MGRKIGKILVVLLPLFFIAGRNLASTGSTCDKAATILELLHKEHYSPGKEDHVFYNNIYDRLINMLDPDGLYFLANETVYVAPEPEEEKRKILCTRYYSLKRLFRKKLLEADSFLAAISGPEMINRQTNLSFFLDETSGFPTTVAEKEKRWLEVIKYNALIEYYYSDSSGKDPGEFAIKEKNIYSRIIERERCRINKILNHPRGFDNLMESLFLNSITGEFDPHTQYFSPAEMQIFESTVSKKANTLGLNLRQTYEGIIVIEEVIPGSPAWKSGEIHAGDELTGINLLNGKEINVFCSNLIEIEELLIDPPVKDLALSIKKPSGKRMNVTIHVEKFIQEENELHTYILNGEKKVGLIYIPSFYSDEDELSGNGVAAEVEKILQQFKKEKIEGLIIDLRQNGGGNILESLKLTSLFLNYGSICMFADRDGNTETIRDWNFGTSYDGPMVIFVDPYTASASEIFTSALMLHNRALVIGTNTFGKGSSQVVLPLDTTNPGEGFLKITVGVFYGINSKSFQRKGITPDIMLPYPFDDSKTGEKALPNSIIPKNNFVKTFYSPLPALPALKLKDRSMERVSNDSFFLKVKEYKEVFTELENMKEYSLDPRIFFNMLSSSFVKLEILTENMKNHEPPYKIEETATEKKKSGNEREKENLKGDIFLSETYNILSDLIDELNRVKTKN